ncbi:MAG: Do family serine endopeptidase [Pseudomonadales bacterium]|jgi:serine protease Do/serine protease DegQ|nr:Do family serine endopeptidase [Pseudomonadales bacterium]
MRGVVVLLLCALLPRAEAALPARMPDGSVPTLAPVMERVTPAVVNIATFTTVAVRNPLFDDPFFRRFFDTPLNQRRFRRTRSAGSGVIVDAEAGYIVTNAHVVERADEIAVTLADGRTVAAALVGTDAQVDLALLRLENRAEDEGLRADPLVPVEFGDSSNLRVGDFVVAIGNPFGLGQTVTSGIVSAVGRMGLGVEGYEDFIQTDASINPGNSGGALVDLNGRLVGINTAIIAPSGGNVGIGFAIPADMVRAVLDELIDHGEVRRGNLGLTVQEMNLDLARAFDVDERDGVIVTAVEDGSPAEKAGLDVGDVIVRIGERAIDGIVDYRARASVVMVGDQVELEYVRGGRRREAELEVPEDQFEKIGGRRLHPGLAGTRLQNHRGDDDPDVAAGVLVLDVAPGSTAARVGLRPGDIVVAANGRPARNLSELTAGIKTNPRRTVLRFWREGVFYDVRLLR